MKKIIVILFTVVLAVYIGGTLIMGAGANSLKSQSDLIMNKSQTQINSINP